MAGEIALPAGAWTPADGTASNGAPQALVLAGTQSAPKGVYRIWAFDASVAEYIHLSTRLPADYVSGGTLKIHWTANVTTGSVVWAARVGCVTPADVDTPLEHAYAAAASVTTAANTTEARRLIESAITLTMDSAAAGDLISLILYRDAANASDTVTVDAELWVAAFSYS